ncbi:MAG: glycosyltransferase [Thermoleophilia bacterium]|nr:glycosyltransferase [Thermoleophilia bacterium]
MTTVMYPSAARPASGTFIRTQVESLRELGVEMDVLEFRGASSKLAYPAGVRATRRRLAGGAYDLVHAHYGFVGWASRLQRRCPLVVSFHGSDLLGRMTAEGRIAAPSRLEAASSRLLGRLVDAAIVQSDQMAARLAGCRRVFVIPHEVDHERFRPVDRAEARRELGLAPGRRYLLFAANPRIPTKGFPFARAVADAVAREEPGTELLVVWREPQERLPLYMNAADVLLFPSFQEGSPNIVKQAMACDLPLVATDVGDVAARTAGAPGCLVLPRDVAAWTGGVRSLLGLGGSSGARPWVADLTTGAVARRVLGAYEAVLAG